MPHSQSPRVLQVAGRPHPLEFSSFSDDLIEQVPPIRAATDLIGSMSQLLQSAKYSDLVIACRGREFAVHRAVVCPQSSFLDKACSGDFQASTVAFSFTDLSEI
jgi:hypothetical protein